MTSLLPPASATNTRWTSLPHQGRSSPTVLGHSGTVGARGIVLQLSRISGADVKPFGRFAAADPGPHPSGKLVQRPRRQAHRLPLHHQRRRPRRPVGPRDRQEPQLAIRLLHAQTVAAVAFDDRDLLAVQRMDGQADRRHRQARRHVRPRGLRLAPPGFGSALRLSVSGPSAAWSTGTRTCTSSSPMAHSGPMAPSCTSASTTSRF